MDVKKLREQMGLTQQELADRAGVTLRTIQNWEGADHFRSVRKGYWYSWLNNTKMVRTTPTELLTMAIRA